MSLHAPAAPSDAEAVLAHRRPVEPPHSAVLGDWWLSAAAGMDQRAASRLSAGWFACAISDDRSQLLMMMNLLDRRRRWKRLDGTASTTPDTEGFYRWRKMGFRLTRNLARWRYVVSDDRQLLLVEHPGSLVLSEMCLVFARPSLKSRQVRERLEQDAPKLGMTSAALREAIHFERALPPQSPSP